MKVKMFDVIVWVSTFIFCCGIALLPERVPLHWDTSWQVSRYGSRYEVLIISMLPILCYYGMLLTKKIDPKRSRFLLREKTYDLMRKGTTGLFIVMVIFIYYLMFNPATDASLLLGLILGIMFIVIGNYMPKLPQNFFMGIRTPWTISSDEVWRKTQKAGGYSFVISGLIILMWELVSLPYLYIIIIILAVGTTVFSTIYSYVVYKKLERETEENKKC